MTISQHLNSSKLIKNLMIVAIIYLIITALIITYQQSPTSDKSISSFIDNKYSSNKKNTVHPKGYKINDPNLFIYNHDKFCNKQWNNLIVHGNNEFDKYIYNTLNKQCGNTQFVSTPFGFHPKGSKQSSNSLHIMVIIDPLHWIDIFQNNKEFKAFPDNETYQQITNAWNGYYGDVPHLERLTNQSFIVVRYEDMALNTDKMVQKICDCTVSDNYQRSEAVVSTQAIDECSVLQNVLFLVFRSSIQDKGVDGRDIILKTWAKKYKSCDVNIKFVNTKSQKYQNDSNGELFEDVIQPPFEAESGMSLLYAIEQYGDDYEWIFKLDDVTYVFIENLINYLLAINVYNKDGKMWWLGNRLQTNSNNKKSIFTSGGAGYLMNKEITHKIIDNIRGWNRENEKEDRRRKEDKYGKYWICRHNEWEDLCISNLLNNKYGAIAANSMDILEFEKFNVWSPMSIFGYGGIYKLPIDWYSRYKRNVGEKQEKVGFEYISKTPITFHYIKPKWMDAYYQLFVMEKKAEHIHIISKRIGKHNERELRLKHLNQYANIIKKYAKTNRIKNIENELISMGIHKIDVKYINISWIINRYHRMSNHNLKIVDKNIKHDIVNIFGYQFQVND